MKSKLMSTSLALLSLTGFGEVMAEEGRNAFDVTLNVDLSKTVSADDVQIRLYHKTHYRTVVARRALFLVCLMSFLCKPKIT